MLAQLGSDNDGIVWHDLDDDEEEEAEDCTILEMVQWLGSKEGVS